MDARSLGQYYTVGNPFKHPAFLEWLQDDLILEPFAGSKNIVHLVNQGRWDCYDIDPKAEGVLQRDTLANFPKGYRTVVTNPPYLAKNSATRRGLPYPSTEYNDLYKYALSLMLKHCERVAVIIPLSFLTCKELKDRLSTLIILNYKMFDDTEVPVCLALFTKEQSDLVLYRGLEKLEVTPFDFKSCKVDMTFNSEKGQLGLYAIDNQKEASIRFCKGEGIQVKKSSRSITRIYSSEFKDLDTLIEKCNRTLNEYRRMTQDTGLTPFKGLRQDGRYRYRLDYKQARKIIEHALRS